jgi:hypothetical protein
MRNGPFCFFPVLLAALPLLAQPVQQQSFQLQEGWNAIFLEVEPDGDVSSVCANLPYTSIWTWDPQVTPAEKIQDQTEGLWNQDGWLVHFPTSRSESMFNNLHKFQANRAYLIHMSASSSWQVSGTPSLLRASWRSEAFNLTGFPVDSVLEPVFSDFFSTCDSLSGGPVYELAPDGHWSLIQDLTTATLASGTSYWVYCGKATDFVAPLSVDVPQVAMLDYGSSISDFTLTFHNRSNLSAGFNMNLLSATQGVPLSFWRMNEVVNTTEWVELPLNSTWPTTPFDPLVVRLAADRSRMLESEGNTTLEVTDGAGTRLWIPLSVQRELPSASKRASSVPETGLWVGTVEIDMVSRTSDSLSVPVPTKSTMSFRLIIHVDDTGVASLIKNVVLMTEPADGTTPAHSVLVTDDNLLPNYEGIALMGNDQVGLRISTVAYDFPGDSWELGPIIADQLQGTLTVEATDPGNPFLHRYNPGHDNLDADFEPITDEDKMESIAFERNITLSFQDVDPFGNLSPKQNEDTLKGIYQETIVGINKNPIVMRGKFRLHRASRRGVLND